MFCPYIDFLTLLFIIIDLFTWTWRVKVMVTWFEFFLEV